MPGKRGGALPGPVWERFWAKVERHECWLWIGAVNDSGYGAIWDGRRLVYAHRLSWKLHGFTVSDDLTIDHLCFTRTCVNPAHLEAVSHQVNVQRAVEHHAGKGWGRPPGFKISEETRERMRQAQLRRQARQRAGEAA